LFFLFGCLVFQNMVFFIGYFVNSLIALFNMLPFGNFDGRKILVWNKAVYGVMIGFAVALMFMQGIVR